MERDVIVYVPRTIVIAGRRHCGNSCPHLHIMGAMELHPVTHAFPPDAGVHYKAECHLREGDEIVSLKWDKRRKYFGYKRCQGCIDGEKRTAARSR